MDSWLRADPENVVVVHCQVFPASSFSPLCPIAPLFHMPHCACIALVCAGFACAPAMLCWSGHVPVPRTGGHPSVTPRPLPRSPLPSPSLLLVFPTGVQAGKGRTGTVIACYLLYTSTFTAADEALDYFALKRANNENGGVNVPSQRRSGSYFFLSPK